MSYVENRIRNKPIFISTMKHLIIEGASFLCKKPYFALLPYSSTGLLQRILNSVLVLFNQFKRALTSLFAKIFIKQTKMCIFNVLGGHLIHLLILV